MGFAHAIFGGRHGHHHHHHRHHHGHHHDRHADAGDDGHRSRAHRAQQLASMLDFSAQQTEKLDTLITQVKTLRGKLLTDQTVQSITNLLDSPTIDRAAARQLLDSRAAEVTQAIPPLVDAAADLLDTLSTEQKYVLRFMLRKLAQRRHQGDPAQEDGTPGSESTP